MKRLQHFTQINYPPQLHLNIMSDNQAMINSLIDRSKYNVQYPKATLVADWDLLEENHATYLEIWPGNY